MKFLIRCGIGEIAHINLLVHLYLHQRVILSREVGKGKKGPRMKSGQAAWPLF
jgi:hypothetical protein